MSISIKPKNSLAKHIKSEKVLDIIEDQVKSILSDLTKKTDPEFITFILNIIENTVSKSFTKEDKIALIIKFLKKHYEITDSESNTIISIINYAYDNKQVIKLSLLKKASRVFINIGKSFIKK
jgi:hypothetical protein